MLAVQLNIYVFGNRHEQIFTNLIYNKPTRYNSGSIVFIKNYKYALHVCWFIIYYRLVMHGNSNIKFTNF